MNFREFLNKGRAEHPSNDEDVPNTQNNDDTNNNNNQDEDNE